MITEDQLDNANDLISRRDELTSLIYSLEQSKQGKLVIQGRGSEIEPTSHFECEEQISDALEAATKTFVSSLKKSLEKVNKELATIITPDTEEK